MAEKLDISCARPVATKVEENESETDVALNQNEQKEVQTMIMVGKEAPDFTAPAYHNGEFINVKLSDYRGKWVVLCFYPGDFTFV